jgi:hypothetical protein
MKLLNLYPQKSPQTASRVVGGEAVVVQPMASTINTFNEVGTRIWELSDGTHSVREIIQEIEEEFEVTPEIAQSDTTDFLIELAEKKMLDLNQENLIKA